MEQVNQQKIGTRKNRLPIDVGKAIELYKNGKSQREIAEFFNVDIGVIRRRFKEIGLKLRTVNGKYRKWEINENYFEIIDTEIKAYFLGLLYADGYVNNKNFVFEITLNEKDKYLLEKFKKELNYSGQLKYRNSFVYKNTNYISKPSYRLQISSKKLCEDLINLGCITKKSLILKFPTEKQVPKHLIKHFIRGYFDGDGSICNFNKYKKSTGSIFTVLGTQEFLKEYSHYLAEGIDTLINSKILKKGSIYSLSISKKDILLKIKNYFYNGTVVFLNRKLEKFNKADLTYKTFRGCKMCSVEGCNEKNYGLCMCKKHYRVEKITKSEHGKNI